MVTFIFNGDEYKIKNHRTTAELMDELIEMNWAYVGNGGRLWQIAADAIKTMLQIHCL